MTDAPLVLTEPSRLLKPCPHRQGATIIEWPTPATPGHYWAQHTAVTPGTAEEAEFEPRTEWEVVWVYENSMDPTSDERLRVFVAGVKRTQCLGNFNWGPPVAFDLDFWLTPKATIMVHAFAEALGNKLACAQAKYGLEDEWANVHWQGDLITQLLDHVRKGDPLDVAAYCAFAWSHGWSIAPVVPVVSGAEQVRAQTDRLTFEDELAQARGLRSRRQRKIQDWAFRCFGITASADPRHRGLRMLEEAIELFQAVDGDAGQAHALVDHVFARPKGQPVQELGGVGVTVLALAAALGLDADVAEQDEVARLLALDPAHFRDRDAAKAAAGFGPPDAAKGGA